MEPLTNFDLGTVVLVIGLCIGAALVGAITLLVIAARQIADLEIPDGADFFETLQHIPITVPIALDLLDMAFDVFSAPIAWIVLELLGLQALQLITVFQGLIPGTQLVPTLTIAWTIARMMRKKKRTELRSALHEYQLTERRSRYAQLRSGRSSLADQVQRKALPGPYDDVIDGEYFEEDLDEPPPYFFDEEENF